MTKKLISAFLAFLLLVPFPSLAELDEEDLLIEEVIDPVETEGPAGVIDTDGTTTITIT